MLLVLCDEGHGAVCYDGVKICPVCEKVDEIKELENKIAKLEESLRENAP